MQWRCENRKFGKELKEFLCGICAEFVRKASRTNSTHLDTSYKSLIASELVHL